MSSAESVVYVAVHEIGYSIDIWKCLQHNEILGEVVASTSCV